MKRQSLSQVLESLHQDHGKGYDPETWEELYGNEQPRQPKHLSLIAVAIAFLLLGCVVGYGCHRLQIEEHPEIYGVARQERAL